jgi:hypothetical protein
LCPDWSKLPEPKKGGRVYRRHLGLLLTLLAGLWIPAKAQNLALAPGSGFAVSGKNPNWSASFGNVNPSGVGTPAAGVSVTSGAGGGALYFSSYNIALEGFGQNNSAVLRAYVSSNFVNSSRLTLQSCQALAGCTNASDYSAIPTNPALPIDVIPIPGIGANGIYTASIGLLVTEGGSGFGGSDQATVTLNLYSYDPGNPQKGLFLKATSVLTLTAMLQSSLGLTLSTAPSGATISGTMPGYSINFGNANGLGIGVPASNISVNKVISGRATTAAIYSTPYLVTPSSSGASTITVCVASNFPPALQATLSLVDSSSGAPGSFSVIPSCGASAIPISNSASSGVPITRYLGVQVNHINAGGGSATAALTYTITGP